MEHEAEQRRISNNAFILCNGYLRLYWQH